VQYVNEKITTHFRERNMWLGVWDNRNFGGDSIERGVFADIFGTLQSYWTYRTSLFVSPGALSDQRTRGGPLVRTLPSWSSDLSLGSDSRKRFFFTVNSHLEGGEEETWYRSGGVTLSYRPSSNLLVSLAPNVSRSHDANQFVTSQVDPAATATYGSRYVFSELEQHSFELATRLDWTLNSRLSFQLYMQPFVASGDYHDYHQLARARSADYVPYTAAVSDPDFNFRSVRGSAVARWEFRPGSALYVVWNENRAETVPLGDFRFRRDLREISTAPSHDVFVIKVSYWIPM
jgi:hypothetical protein